MDVVVDPVGGRHSEPALRALRHLGRFCVIGFATGPIASIPLNQVLLNNRTVVGVDWGGWTFKDPLGNRASSSTSSWTMVGDGRLHPTDPRSTRSRRRPRSCPVSSTARIPGKVVLVP